MMPLPMEIFGHSAEQLQREFDEHGQIVSFDKTEHMFDCDDTLRYFYIFLGGKIKIFQMNLKNAKEQTIYLMGRGDMFDTVSLLDGKVHEVMVEIIESGKALRIPIGKAREWMYDYPVFGEMILKYVARQLRQVEELATDLTLYDTQERLLKLIVQNMERKDESGQGMLDNLSHTELANLIGTVRHVVDRHIKKFKEDGIIESARKKIILKDYEKLLSRMKDLMV
jgi:CRP-like cAMP-binding protein